MCGYEWIEPSTCFSSREDNGANMIDGVSKGEGAVQRGRGRRRPPAEMLHLLSAVIVWLVTGTTISSLNKWIFAVYNFRYPLLLSALHMLTAIVVDYGLIKLQVIRHRGAAERDLTPSAKCKVFLLSLTFCASIAFGNMGLNHVQLSFAQMIYTTTPLFTLAISTLILGKQHHILKYTAMMPICLGASFSIMGEVQFHQTGCFYVFAATMLRGVKSIQQNDSGDEAPIPHEERALTQGVLKTLASKLDDLSTCNELIGKHGAALQRSLSELEELRGSNDNTDKVKAVNERATLFRITSNAMLNACRDFLDVAESHSRRWQKALHYEREQRHHLEETIEQLAKQHNSLERAWRENPSSYAGVERPQDGDVSDDNEEAEFFDAMEDSTAFITVTAASDIQHKRSGSDQSMMSGGVHSDWTHNENDTSTNHMQLRRTRRTRIPDKPNYSLNLWSIMKNCIGKDLSRIPMPVNFNEPLSMLQRLTEDLEYSELLDRAARCDSSLEQMCLVAAFSVSSYSTTVHRTAKPFNPLLGETYELDRLEEYGYRSISEQISHHPPAAAHHVTSQRGWTLWQHITIDSKFRGKYISVVPLGNIHLQFHSSGNHYVWSKVTSTVHNIIVGKLWIDQSGDIDIVNTTTKDTCRLKFSPYSYFSREVPRKVTGVVEDREGTAHYILSGTWDDKMESAKIVESSHGGGGSEGKQKTVYQTLQPKLLWKKYPLPENAENMHFFSSLALTLNEPEEGVAPTDSRLRPDQRLMEEGLWDEANIQKQRLEERQRQERKKREAQANQALEDGQDIEGYQPLWFDRKTDENTGDATYFYKGGYWEAKERQNWSQCPRIF